MNELTFKLLICAISVIIVRWYLYYIIDKYGRQSSISAAAKKLQADKQVYLTFVFIYFGLGSLLYVAQSWPMLIATSMLIPISVITGYNPNYQSIKLQNNLHVGFTMTAISSFTLDIVLSIIKHWNEYKVLNIPAISILYMLGLGFVLLFTVYHLIQKTHNRTWRIEDAFIWLLHGYIPIEYIILNLK